MTSPTRPRIRTNAALSRGDFGPYTVTGIKKMNGNEGQAFSGTIKRGRTAVADIVQDGNGGETMVYPYSGDSRLELETFVAEHWNFDLVLSGFGDTFNVPHTLYTFADAIFAEFDLRRSLNRYTKAGNLVILDDAALSEVEQDDQVSSFSTIKNGFSRAAEVYSLLAARGKANENTLYWTGTEWVNLATAVTPTP